MAYLATPAACANCHYAFVPDEPAGFCPRCGQQNHDVNISFGHVAEEFLEGIFHFDGKVFRTAGLLLFKPGELTRRFLAGHRVPYVPPIRLYVFISFVFFLLLGFLGGRGAPESKGRGKGFDEDFGGGASAARPAASAGPAIALPAHQPGKKPPPAAGQAAVGQRAATASSQQGPPGGNLSVAGLHLSAAEIKKLPKEITEAQADSVVQSKGQASGFWNRLKVQRTVRWRDTTREELLHQALRGASILFFLLMPLAALLLKGAYFRQHRYYLSHLIFTVHMQCFLFVYAAVALLLSQLPLPDGLGAWGTLIPIGYFAVALHTFYQQSWPKTLAKSLLLGVAYSLVIGFCLVAVAVLGLLVF